MSIILEKTLAIKKTNDLLDALDFRLTQVSHALIR